MEFQLCVELLAADVTALSHFAVRPQEGCVVSVFISYLTNCAFEVKFLSIKGFFLGILEVCVWKVVLLRYSQHVVYYFLTYVCMCVCMTSFPLIVFVIIMIR